MYANSVHFSNNEHPGALHALRQRIDSYLLLAVRYFRREKQMKLFAKIGVLSLVGGVALLSASVHASNEQAQEDYVAMKHDQAGARAANDIIKLYWPKAK